MHNQKDLLDMGGWSCQLPRRWQWDGLLESFLRNYASSEAIAAGGQTDDFFECLLVHVPSLCICYLVVCRLIQRIAKPVSSKNHSMRFFYPGVERQVGPPRHIESSFVRSTHQSCLGVGIKITSHYKYPNMLLL
jgi:hypothetical protein